MFTQSMPALAQALSGALPEAALKQLMQALGNCQQPLTHRGAINLQPPTTTGAGGLARPGTWNANDYTTILPKAGDNVFVDMPGNTTTNQNVTNTSNYDGHNFHFPINQDFNYNNYYGGDTFNVAGNSTFESTTVNNLKAGDTKIENLTVTNVYYTGDGNGGGAAGGGGGGGGGPGGGGGGGGGNIPLPPGFPGVISTATVLKDVSVRGNVTVPNVEAATVADKTVTLASTTATTTVTVSGLVPVPDMSSATATVSIPTSGSFSGSITGMKLTAGTLAGTVTVPVVTGGYIDANCKLQLTTGTTQCSVSFSGAPAVDATNPGSVAGSVSLSASTQTYGVTFACTGTTNVVVVASGTVTYDKATTAALKSDVVTILAGVVNKKLNLTLKTTPEFLIYIRPRF